VKNKGILYMIIASCFFATMGACLKFVLAFIPLYEGIFFRCLVTALVLGVVIKRKGLPMLGVNGKIMLARSVSGFIAMSCGFYALTLIPLADATVLHHTAPLFVAFFSTLFLGEQLGFRLLLLMLGALVGVVMVLQPSFDYINIGALLGVLNGAFAGLAYTFVRKLRQSDSPWVIAFHFSSLSLLLSCPLMLLNFQIPTLWQGLALIGAGLLGTGGQVFMTAAYGYDLASKLAPFSYFSLVLSLFYGFVFWNEIPNTLSIAGMILVVLFGIAIGRLKFHGPKPVALGEE
jgi:drug/metabolite transporter (DMT)-like permease